MGDVEVFVFLLLVVAVLAGLGLRSGIPYPVVLVVGGLAIGLIPGLPSPQLDPDLVFFVFLPPLLYAAAFTASAYELRANARPIGLLAIGLVLVTVGAVAVVGHAVIGLAWAPAFVLGAVLGPTDPVAATAVMRRLGAPGQIETILEGESLVNDGTGLTAYKIAVAATASGAVSVGSVPLRFVAVAAGGIAIGLVAGWVFGRLRSYVTDPSMDVTLSILTPFAAYIPAERIGASGVLAAVAAGVYIGTRSLDLVEAGNRLRTVSFWESLSFLLNGLLFLLIGLQVPHIVDGIKGAHVLPLAGRALLVSAVVMGVRLAWMFVVPTLFRALSPFSRVDRPRTTRRERLVLGWSGMRGGVSLAAALAIPVTVGGSRFPDRDLVVFLAYAAVVVTLLVPGATLSPLLRRLGLGEPEDRRRADAEARLRITHAALERLEALARDDSPPDGVVSRLRDRYEARVRALEARAEADDGDGPRVDVGEAARLQAEMIEAERDVLRAMRRERAFPADLLREIERELDLDESRLRARIRT